MSGLQIDMSGMQCENTYFRHLVHCERVDQTIVDMLLVELGYVDPFSEIDNG